MINQCVDLVNCNWVSVHACNFKLALHFSRVQFWNYSHDYPWTVLHSVQLLLTTYNKILSLFIKIEKKELFLLWKSQENFIMFAIFLWICFNKCYYYPYVFTFIVSFCFPYRQDCLGIIWLFKTTRIISPQLLC